MKVAIITYVAQLSSRSLVEGLQEAGIEARMFDMNEARPWTVQGYDYVFGYGCSAATHSKGKRLNKPIAVQRCVDKVATFKALEQARLSTVHFVTKAKDIPKSWEWVVIRSDRCGRKAEGYQCLERKAALKADGDLFTEYFDHKREYRIVVFNGQVVGRYFKKHRGDEGWHDFMLQPKKGFEEMDRQCIAAAKALGIDYVGFDVVSRNKHTFKILEANSGPILTDEARQAIIDYFVERK